MKKYDPITGLLILGVVFGGIAGWVMNLVTIAHANFSNIDGLLVLRIIGIFISPIGAVLGWV